MAKYRRIAFRVDADHRIGTGHLMRCLALADELKKRNSSITFLARNMPDNLRRLILQNNFEYMQLPSEKFSGQSSDLMHAEWLGVSQKQDGIAVVNALEDQNWDWMVVDHYALDSTWEDIVRECAKNILAIDDLADRSHTCDVLLDQNAYLDNHMRYWNKVPEYCDLLLGPSYALLRSEFSNLHLRSKKRDGKVRKVLVFFGGVDAKDYTSAAIDALAKIKIPFDVDVVIGAQHPFINAIKEKCASLEFKCHIQTNNMATLMAHADLAIGAGGTATWERCCLGLPTLCLGIAENQFQLIKDSAKLGLLYSPEIRGGIVDTIYNHVKVLINNTNLCSEISANGLSMVDGLGAGRVASKLCNK